jgi:hypothetical protein
MLLADVREHQKRGELKTELSFPDEVSPKWQT